MKTTESILKLAPALVKVQAEMVNVKRNQENPFFHSQYADLAAVLETVRPILSKHGLAVVQFAEKNINEPLGNPTIVITRLIHESGEYLETEVAANNVLKTPQDFGSTVTYLRRYALMAICGTAAEDEDEDGNRVSQPSTTPEKGKKKGAPEKELTIQERIDRLPQDVKDLMAKAGCLSLDQRYRLMKSSNWNMDAVKKACLEQIEANKA